MPSLEKGDGWIMVDSLGVHRFDDANVISNLVMKGQEVADPLAGLAMLVEFGE